MDVDYPIEVDDEFWECEDPSLNFKQPESQPCKISAFVSSIKLHEIIGTTLKTVVSLDTFGSIPLDYSSSDLPPHFLFSTPSRRTRRNE